jgi:hypothetical protein
VLHAGLAARGRRALLPRAAVGVAWRVVGPPLVPGRLLPAGADALPKVLAVRGLVAVPPPLLGLVLPALRDAAVVAGQAAELALRHLDQRVDALLRGGAAGLRRRLDRARLDRRQVPAPEREEPDLAGRALLHLVEQRRGVRLARDVDAELPRRQPDLLLVQPPGAVRVDQVEGVDDRGLQRGVGRAAQRGQVVGQPLLEA